MPLTSHQPELNALDASKRALIKRYRGAFTKVLGHPMEMLTTEQVYKIALAAAGENNPARDEKAQSSIETKENDPIGIALTVEEAELRANKREAA